MADPHDDTSRARAPIADVMLEHERLRENCERSRIAWAGEYSEPTKRAQKRLRETLREHTALATAKLIDLMVNGESDAVQLAAVKEFYDRAYGKPKETLEVDDKRDAEAAKVAEQLRALRSNPDTAGLLLSLAEASAKAARS